MQYISFPINLQGMDAIVSRVQNYEWIFQWGMFIFLIATFGIAVWIFMDSTQKNKADKALVPRILSMIGVFLISPAFIFRYTGTADGVMLKVKLLAEAGSPFYEGAIPYNVKWLFAGYGPMIAMITMLGVCVSIIAAVVYTSTVSRQRLGTEFTRSLSNQFESLRSDIDSVRAGSGSASATMSGASGRGRSATIVETSPQRVATTIDIPGGPGTATLLGLSGVVTGRSWNIPMTGGKLGRDNLNLVVFEDGKASNLHAKIHYTGGTWIIEDAASTNGTYVNNSRIAGREVLSGGDQIRIGGSTFSFSVNS